MAEILKRQNALTRCRSQIVKDLDVRYIIDKLIEDQVIDQITHDLIMKQVSAKIPKY